MAKGTTARKSEPEPVEDGNSAANTGKHEDQIGTVDVKETPPEPKEIPNEDTGFEDPDDLELAEARKAVEEEGSTPPEDEPAPAGDPTGDEPPAPKEPSAQPAPAGDTQMVPIARLNEEIRKREDIERAAAYYKGIADARGTVMQPATSESGQQQTGQQQPAPPPQPKTPDEAVAELRKERRAAFKRYEEGEIDADEYQEVADRVEDQIWSVRNQAAAPQQQQGKADEDLYLKEKSDEIEAQHPYLREISDFDLYYLVQTARANLGYGSRTLNSQELLTLRQTVAEMSDTFGPQMIGRELEPGATQQQPTGGAPSVAAQRHAALVKAAGAPPDIGNLGAGGQPNPKFNEDQIAAMSDEEIIARMPESDRRAILKDVY